MAEPMRITNFARLDEGVQLFLPIFEPHRDVRGASRYPKEIEIIAIPLVLIEGGDGAKHAVGPFESDRGIDLPAEVGRGRIEEILLRLAKLEGRIERDWQRLRFLDLVRRWAGGCAAGEEKAKKGRRDSHDASIKREERSGVNFRRPGLFSSSLVESPPLVRASSETRLKFRCDSRAVRTRRLSA